MYRKVGENIRHAHLPEKFFLYRAASPAYQIPIFVIPYYVFIEVYFGICKGLKERVGIM